MSARRVKIIDPVNNIACQKCGGYDRDDKMILCDKCPTGWHMDCLSPPLRKVPAGDWHCPECRQNPKGNSKNGVVWAPWPRKGTSAVEYWPALVVSRASKGAREAAAKHAIYGRQSEGAVLAQFLGSRSGYRWVQLGEIRDFCECFNELSVAPALAATSQAFVPAVEAALVLVPGFKPAWPRSASKVGKPASLKVGDAPRAALRVAVKGPNAGTGSKPAKSSKRNLGSQAVNTKNSDGDRKAKSDKIEDLEAKRATKKQKTNVDSAAKTTSMATETKSGALKKSVQVLTAPIITRTVQRKSKSIKPPHAGPRSSLQAEATSEAAPIMAVAEAMKALEWVASRPPSAPRAALQAALDGAARRLREHIDSA